MKLSISEILDKTSKLNTQEEQVQFIRANDSVTLRQILEYALSPAIKWLLPPGAPPFQYANDIETHGMLYSQAKKLYLFIEGGHPNLNRFKRETLFVQLLESIHPADADLIVAVKDKKIPYNISPAVFNEAFGFEFATNAPTSPGVEVKEVGPKETPKRGRGRPKKVNQEVNVD